MPPAATAAARTRADRRTVETPRPAPRPPRRVSGPVSRAEPVRRRDAPRPAPARRRSPALPGLRIELPHPASPLAILRSLPDHRLLDRLIRGRAWIPLLGVLLAGIVAMRVEVLKLGVNVGRSVAAASTLQSQNQILRENVASLSDTARIERLASGMGMVLPGPMDVNFVPAAGARNLARAAAGILTPAPASFEAGLATETAANSATLSTVAPTPPSPAGTGSASSGTATTDSTGSTPAGQANTATAGAPTTGAASTGGGGSGAASTPPASTGSYSTSTGVPTTSVGSSDGTVGSSAGVASTAAPPTTAATTASSAGAPPTTSVPSATGGASLG